MAKTTHPHAVDVTTANGVVTARIIGPAIEEHRGKAILETVRRAIDEAGDSLRALVLDFGDVTFINSSAIASCIELRNGLNEKGVRAIIYRPDGELLKILRTAKLDKLFQIVETSGELGQALAGSQ